MQQSIMLHLQELREAHAARLRALEVQFAQFGVHCPVHIKVEIEQIQKMLTAIEKQVQDPSLAESAPVAEPVLRSTRSRIQKISVHIAYGILASVVIAVLLRAFFKPSFTEMQGANNPNVPPPLWNQSGAGKPTGFGGSSSDTPITALAFSCEQQVVAVIFQSGLMIWKNPGLNQVSLALLPPFTRVTLYCHTSELGEVEIVFVRFLKIQGDEAQAIWIMESYRCYSDRKLVCPMVQ